MDNWGLFKIADEVSTIMYRHDVKPGWGGFCRKYIIAMTTKMKVVPLLVCRGIAYCISP